MEEGYLTPAFRERQGSAPEEPPLRGTVEAHASTAGLGLRAEDPPGKLWPPAARVRPPGAFSPQITST